MTADTNGELSHAGSRVRAGQLHRGLRHSSFWPDHPWTFYSCTSTRNINLPLKRGIKISSKQTPQLSHLDRTPGKQEWQRNLYRLTEKLIILSARYFLLFCTFQTNTSSFPVSGSYLTDPFQDLPTDLPAGCFSSQSYLPHLPFLPFAFSVPPILCEFPTRFHLISPDIPFCNQPLSSLSTVHSGAAEGNLGKLQWIKPIIY